MSDELTGKSAAELARLVRARVVSPVELVAAYLRRIEELNPRLNAVVTLAKDASERARRAEADLMRGDTIGALHGVPLTVKETIDVAGLRSTCGSTARASVVPTSDAPAVARLRAAGAIILGKTNASELALDYTTENPVYGRTNHPQDESLTPGGSSGGCAAATAARLTAASLASDLAGSIRLPAHFCGVAGLKPTAGRVPGAGHCPPMVGAYRLGASLGPVARRIEDLSLLFEVLESPQGTRRAAGAGERTPGQGSSPSAESGREGLERARARLRGRRVAWYADDASTPVTPETRAAVERAARALADAGMVVSEERPPGVERATELWVGLFSYATQQFVRSVYEGREAEAGAQARVMLGRASAGVPPTLAEFFRVWAERDRLRDALLEWMETRPLLLAPVGAMPAFGHDSPRTFALEDKVFGLFRAFSYAQAFNVFDLPALSVPAGRSPDNLPIGVQLVGQPFAEDSILDAARIVESLSLDGGNRI